MVKPVFHFFKIHRKMIFGNPPIIVKNMFSKTPKTFDAVNVILGTFIDQLFFVLDGMVLTPTFQGVVASEFVGEVNRAFSGFSSDNRHQFISRHFLHHFGINPAIALQQAKNDAFALGSTTPLSLASAAKIALIHLNLAEKSLALQFRHMVNGLSQFLIYSSHRLVAQIKIACQTIGRLSLVKSFDYGNLSSQLFQTFMPPALPTFGVAATSAIDFKRTAKYAFSTPQKVGRTAENILLPFRHMDILVPHGYDYH